jgi:hypothetical protein
MHDTIINPMTGRKVSIYGNLGRSILNNYIQTGGGKPCVYNSNTGRCRNGGKDDKDDPVNCKRKIPGDDKSLCLITEAAKTKKSAAKPRAAAAAKPRVAAAAKPRTPAAAKPKAAAAKRKSPAFKSVALAARAGIRMRKDANRHVRFDDVAAAPKKAAPKKAPKKAAPAKKGAALSPLRKKNEGAGKNPPPKKAAPAKKVAALSPVRGEKDGPKTKVRTTKTHGTTEPLSAGTYYRKHGELGINTRCNIRASNPKEYKCLLLRNSTEKRPTASAYWSKDKGQEKCKWGTKQSGCLAGKKYE